MPVGSSARVAVLVGSAALALVGGWIAATWSLSYQTADFFCLWMGGRFVAFGLDPYDERAWAAATGGLYPDPRGYLLPSSCPGRFGYPYWTAIALAPFGALPIEFAATLWMALAIVATLAGAALAWRVAAGTRDGLALYIVIVLFAQPFWTLFVSGQISGVMLAIVSIVAWSLARQHERIAGLSLAALALKPQVGLLVPPLVLLAAIGWRRLTVLVAVLATAAVVVLVSFALAPGWANAWANEITARRLGEVAIRPTAWGFAAETFGDPAYGLVILAAIAIAIGLVARDAALAPGPFVALAVALSLVATPYISTYDHLVLVLPWAMTLALAMRAEGAARRALLVGVVVSASLLPWVLFAVPMRGGSLTWSVAVPAAAALLLALALRAPRAS